MGRLDPVDQLRRRERQQSLVAELGRSALTGTAPRDLVEQALDAAAEGLGVEFVGLFEPSPDERTFIAHHTRGWDQSKRSVPTAVRKLVAHAYRAGEGLVATDSVAVPVRG